MCAYNRLNGVYCSEHDWLLNDVLRRDWGFEGAVMTDWGAANDRVRGIEAGDDLEMPTSGGVNDRRVVAAVRRGELAESVLDRSVARVVELVLKSLERSSPTSSPATADHHALARRAAAEGAVLLKNDDSALPLPPDARIAVIGAFAKQPRYQGTGSSRVTPTRLDRAFDAMRGLIGHDAGHPPLYAPGYDPELSELDPQLINEARAVAADADTAVVFAGLPTVYESEGFDRAHMRLPEQHDRLIEAVCAANPNTVVVLANGAPVEMPWVDLPKAILEAYLGGQAGGPAVADILFGCRTPCGKLAETFPLRQADIPSDQWFPGANRQVQYREGLYVGYRYFDSFQRPVLFPFGHGLSYTRFDYEDLRVTSQEGQPCRVALTLTNAGEVGGAEIVQVYVHRVDGSHPYRPEQELRGFLQGRVGGRQKPSPDHRTGSECLRLLQRRSGRLGDGTGRVRNPRRRVEPGHPLAPAHRGGYPERRARRSQVGRERPAGIRGRSTEGGRCDFRRHARQTRSATRRRTPVPSQLHAI